MIDILQITELTAGYQDLQVLKEVSLNLRPRTMSVLMGPNGAGKSTLLKTIYGLTHKTSGLIKFDGKNITNLPTHKLAEQGIGFVPQGKMNFSSLTVEENLRLGAYGIKNKTVIEARLAKLYQRFPVLQEKRSARAGTLSGGQQQILAIARALMREPKLLLLDEPSLGLAPKLVKEMFALIRNLKETFNVTLLIVEHNLKSLLNIADEGYVMVQGEIVAHDSCENLKKSDIMKQVFVGTFE